MGDAEALSEHLGWAIRDETSQGCREFRASEPKVLFPTGKGCGLGEDAPQVSPSLTARREDDHSHGSTALTPQST